MSPIRRIYYKFKKTQFSQKLINNKKKKVVKKIKTNRAPNSDANTFKIWLRLCFEEKKNSSQIKIINAAL